MGYSLEFLNFSVMGEVQFGGFANGGQLILNTSIAARERKRRPQYELAPFLPHGYEGQCLQNSSAKYKST